MPTPTFDGKQLFSSTDSNSNVTTQGVCYVPDYSQVLQTIHFNGEAGNRYISHGYADQAWKFEGVLAATSLSALVTAIKAIQTYADADPGQASSYKPLADTFGNTYPSALIQKITKSMVHKTLDGYMAQVTVEGVVQGNVQDSGGSS